VAEGHVGHEVVKVSDLGAELRGQKAALVDLLCCKFNLLEQ
jgi:hypothetical protein